MADNFSPLSLAVISSLLLLLWCVVRAAISIVWKPMMKQRQLMQQGVKGRRYKLAIGDAREIISSMRQAWSKPINLTDNISPRVLPFVHEMVETYGKIALMWFGMTPRLIISDPELMKEVLSNKSGHFQMSPLNPLVKLLTTGLSTLEGEKWAHHRGIITPAFHLDKLKRMVPAFCMSCGEMIERWEESISPRGTCELDVWQEFQNLTADVISRTAFGSSYKEGKRIFQLQKEQVLLAIEGGRSPYIPGFRFLPTRKNRRRIYLHREIKLLLRDLIYKKEQAMKNGKCSNDDLLGLLLESNKDGQDHADGLRFKGLTIDEVTEECKLFYFAGQETTSVLLTWTVFLLAMHQIWQDRAREEVKQICGRNMPNFDKIGQLKIVNMILHEVLRLYPPVAAQYRHVYRETKLGDISLPGGVSLVMPTLLIHHNPEIWGEEAEKFKPERFSEGVSKASRGQAAFFPFGWGPKTCIGQNFAMLEAKIALSMILQHFSFELSPSYTHCPYNIITLQPQHGTHIILHRL